MPQSERLFTRSDEGYFAASPRYGGRTDLPESVELCEICSWLIR